MVDVKGSRRRSYLRSVLFTVLLPALLFSCYPYDKRQAPSTHVGGQTWAVLVYMVAANTLEPAALFNLAAMANAGSNDNVVVLAQVERSLQYTTADAVDQPGWKGTKRFVVNQNSLCEVGTESCPGLAPDPSVDMGAPETLRDFIAWGIPYASAPHTFLVLWDHGGGWTGFGIDELHHSELDLPGAKQGIHDGLTKAGVQKFDLIGFDSCLMATLETAYELRAFTSRLVFSEEREPGHGWDYTSFIGALGTSPAITADDLGRSVADSYVAFAKARGDGTLATLSVVDTSRVEALAAATNSLGDVLSAPMPTEPTALALANDIGKARLSASEFGKEAKGKASSGTVDLSEIAGLLGTNTASDTTAVAWAVHDVTTAAKAAVIYNAKGPGVPEATGLSVYFPSTVLLYNTSYSRTDFASAGDAGWFAFLHGYLGGIAKIIPPPGLGPVTVTENPDGGRVQVTAPFVPVGPAPVLSNETLWVFRDGADAGAAVVATYPAATSDGGLQASWLLDVMQLDDGTHRVDAPLVFERTSADGLANFFIMMVNYAAPGSPVFVQTTLEFIAPTDPTASPYALELIGAFQGTNGASAPVVLETGGRMHALVMTYTPSVAATSSTGSNYSFAEEGAPVELQVTTYSNGTLAFPQTASRRATPGAHSVGFSMTDLAGRFSTSFTSYVVGPAPVATCTSAFDCADQQVCTAGVCQDCTAGSDAGALVVCGESCVAESDLQCGFGCNSCNPPFTTCQNHVCTSTTSNAACPNVPFENDTACGWDGLFCSDCTLNLFATQCDTQSHACVVPPPQPCPWVATENNSNCGWDGFACMDCAALLFVCDVVAHVCTLPPGH